MGHWQHQGSWLALWTSAEPTACLHNRAAQVLRICQEAFFVSSGPEEECFALDVLLDPVDPRAQAQIPCTTTEQTNYLIAVEKVLALGGVIGDRGPQTREFISSLGGGWGFGKQGTTSDNTAEGHCPCLTRTRCSSDSY